MAEDQRRETDKVGLSINYSKTKILTNIAHPGEIQIGSNPIECVQDYKYRGKTMSFRNKYEKELKIRRANTWKALWPSFFPVCLRF